MLKVIFYEVKKDKYLRFLRSKNCYVVFNPTKTMIFVVNRPYIGQIYGQTQPLR